MPSPQAQAKPSTAKSDSQPPSKMSNTTPQNAQLISEREIKQNSGASASMALQAMQKAWELRQAANAAGDPNAREEILAKSINKEIEAESFGKAAKYTQSGAFQGLAAGAGLGVLPGVTLGKITGALVGGLVATVTGLLGGGIGAAYGALHGPMWDLGQLASHGVRSVVGDFPNWSSTPAQKRALEKMVMQTKDTQAPSKEELERMKAEAPDDMPQTWAQSVRDMTSWRPSVPSLPAIPSMPSMKQAGAAMGLGGLGASLPGWGGGPTQGSQQTGEKVQSSQNTLPIPASRPSTDGQSSEPKSLQPQEAPRPKEPPKPKEAPRVTRTDETKTSQGEKRPMTAPKKPSRTESQNTEVGKQSSPQSENKENKPPAVSAPERRKPRKLETRSLSSKTSSESATRRPRKLETRKSTT
ncbi:hypothetical protein EJ05DRAFT_471522 [Pseudovirgaria hyperparasitica]|uniref:Uncharacterized protein n=1 Tax=Pseudovirgaria hyperparasitica TaxID=470096 RepID=A0A6A6WJR5_9PEZI|nr:uncharacterized protein EJ05DRAFT_471522 [Pseudovirgaria hyperparasitica]KAF2762516.1 hypothetical protein EJ05DRAFT_471522 [Pseudovirgaria hyperparasitica]